jgi:hypothetical protein
MTGRSNTSSGSRARASRLVALVSVLAVVASIAFLSHARDPSADGRPITAIHPDVPIPAHTGGFGEPTCQACHFDSDLNDPQGLFEVRGFPAEHVADSTYLIEILLSHPGLAAAGFQVTVRTDDGRDAGVLESLDDRVKTVEHRDVTYAGHTMTGTAPSAGGRESRWEVQWTPASDAEVVLHAVGNAANGDRSEFGDFIFATEKRSVKDRK